MGAQNFNFALNLLKSGIISPKFCIFEKSFQIKKTIRQIIILGRKQFPPAPDTTPLNVILLQGPID